MLGWPINYRKLGREVKPESWYENGKEEAEEAGTLQGLIERREGNSKFLINFTISSTMTDQTGTQQALLYFLKNGKRYRDNQS